MKPCPVCNADAAKPRVGSLGETRGVWCTACGHATDTAEAWEIMSRVASAVHEAMTRNIGATPQQVIRIDDYLGHTIVAYPRPGLWYTYYGGAPMTLFSAGAYQLDVIASQDFAINRPPALTDSAFRTLLVYLYQQVKK